jgi:hypothetical protein
MWQWRFRSHMLFFVYEIIIFLEWLEKHQTIVFAILNVRTALKFCGNIFERIFLKQFFGVYFIARFRFRFRFPFVWQGSYALPHTSQSLSHGGVPRATMLQIHSEEQFPASGALHGPWLGPEAVHIPGYVFPHSETPIPNRYPLHVSPASNSSLSKFLRFISLFLDYLIFLKIVRISQKGKEVKR